MANDDIVMTTKELAEYIKIHEKTVIKQAQEGKLPGVKIGNQWRFHLGAIDEILHSTVIKTQEDKLNDIIKTTNNIIPLSRLTDIDLIELDLRARTKDDVIEAVATIAQKANITSDHSAFASLLKKREELMSTAVGNGIAIPHPRNPEPGMFQRPYIIITRTTEPIDFAAPDGKKVSLFFTICAPNEFVHLRLLAKIAKLLHEKKTHDQIRAAKSKKDLMQVFLDFDRRRIFPLTGEKMEQPNIQN